MVNLFNYTDEYVYPIVAYLSVPFNRDLGAEELKEIKRELLERKVITHGIFSYLDLLRSEEELLLDNLDEFVEPLIETSDLIIFYDYNPKDILQSEETVIASTYGLPFTHLENEESLDRIIRTVRLIKDSENLEPQR